MASITKRGENTYRITVYTGYDVNGKKLRKLKTVTLDPSLTERQVYKELQKIAAEFERQVETGQYLDGGKVTLQEFAERWMHDYAEKQLAPKTISSYSEMLSRRIIPALGHIPLNKLQPVHLIEFYNNLEEEGMRLDGKYKAKPRLIEEIHGFGNKKGYAAFARAVGVSDKTIASLCKGGNTTPAIEGKKSTYLGMDIKKLFSPSAMSLRLTSNTISHYHRLLSSMLTDAVQWQVIYNNPAERVKPPKVDRKEPRHYEEEDVERLLEVLEEEHIRIKTVVYLVLFAGMRLGELSGLEWPDFDFNNLRINIRRASQYINFKDKPKDEKILTKRPKNETSIRSITIPQMVFDVLKQYKQWQNAEKLMLGDKWQRREREKLGDSYKDNQRLFTTYDGSPVFPDTPSKWFQKFLDKHNLPPLTFHQLRHTNASLLIAQGVDVSTVGKRLGHSTPATTMKIYIHALQKPDQEASEKLEKRFNNFKKTGNKKQA